MIIGEVVEVLIGMRKNCEIMSREEEALIQACNVLDKLPRLEEATTYEPVKN